MIAPSQILDFYFAHNIRLVFWPQIGDRKGPHDPGWPSHVTTRDEYRDGLRVGILCGQEYTAGRFLHDVDIDWEPGSLIAQALLPQTDFIFGRAGKKVSHCWYSLPEALPSFKYEDPDGTCLIELRGTKLDGTLGLQTMAPPSIWSKNDAKEALTFVKFNLPAHLEQASLLKQKVCLSAIAMLFAKYFGKQGFGHEIRLAWAGFLLRAGLSMEECLAVGNAIMRYTGNSDKTDIKLAVESTHKRLEAKDKKVKGGPALAKMMGEHGKAIIKRVNEWLGRDSDFIRNADGLIIRDHQENIGRALAMLNVELSYNEFADRLLVNRTHLLEDRQLNELWFRIDEDFRFRPSIDFFEKVIKRIAWNNSFHPVRDYFASLTWDGVPRIDEWLIRSATAADTLYIRAISAIFLIAAVRRIKTPGCKYDEMVVLESKQGLQKSSALAALCPVRDWFTDDFQLNATSQRMIESTSGKWIIEVSELSGMRSSLVELLKSNLSRQVDGPARMAYARLPIERPRQFVAIGTTNSRQYLADQTGSRRFWPAPVQKFDVEWIVATRDQLWAEAVHRESAGESIRLPESLWPAAGAEQEDRREIDPWEILIRDALLANSELHEYDDRRSRVVSTVLWNSLGVLPDRQSRRDQMRLSEIMQRLGFTRTRVRLSGCDPKVGFVSDTADWCTSSHALLDDDSDVPEQKPSAAKKNRDDDEF